MYKRHDTQHDQNLIQAQEQGLKTYQGPVCKHGHDGIRYVINRCCIKCAGKRKGPVLTGMEKHSKKWDPRRQLLASAKSRAKKFGRDFDLELDDIVIPDVCPVLGTSMKSPSLDRTRSSEGYTKGNVQVISHRANTLKNNATIEELQKVLDYVKSNS